MKIGIAQINTSFSGANYLPYVAGLLQSYAEAHLPNACDLEFLTPLYKRLPVANAVAHFIDADVVGFSLYVWNVELSLRIAHELRARNKDRHAR